MSEKKLTLTLTTEQVRMLHLALPNVVTGINGTPYFDAKLIKEIKEIYSLLETAKKAGDF